MYPEFTPIMEAYRAAADLKDQVGIETAFVVANYLLPEEYGDNAVFANRRAQQGKYLGEIKDRFETPMMCAPLRRDEPVGLGELRAFGDEITGLSKLTEREQEVTIP
jgi:arsenite-transporting ATPase